MFGFTVTKEQTQILVRAARDVVAHTDARLVLVCERSGVVLAQTPSTGNMDIDTIAALGAGACAATQALARHIDESAFNSVTHRGAHKSIYIQAVHGQFLVLVIFDTGTTLGLVKLYVGRMVEHVSPVLTGIAEGGTAGTELFELATEGDFFSAASA